MGRPLSSRGCPRCEGTVYIEKDPWEEDDAYLVCWRCGHVLSDEEEEQLIELLTESRSRQSEERRNWGHITARR